MTAEQLDVVEDILSGSLDLPCEARRHSGDMTAEWVVWQVQCCPSRPLYGLACTPCLTHYLTSTKGVRCRDCGFRLPVARDCITHFERIDKLPTVA